MPTYRANYQGTLYGLDVFQYGFTFTGSGTLSDAATAGLGWITALWAATGVPGQFNTGMIHNALVTQQLGGFGQPIVDSQIDTITQAGTNSLQPLPPQIAVCVSLLTGFAGARNRGRFYMPGPANDILTTTGRYPTADATELADGIQDGFQSLLSDGFTPVVRSNVGAGAETVINAIRVGNVFDTQRRRRNQIAETYVARSI